MNKYVVATPMGEKYTISATYYTTERGTVNFVVLGDTEGNGKKYVQVASFRDWVSIVKVD